MNTIVVACVCTPFTFWLELICDIGGVHRMPSPSAARIFGSERTARSAASYVSCDAAAAAPICSFSAPATLLTTPWSIRPPSPSPNSCFRISSLMTWFASFSRLAIAFFSLAFSIALNGLSLSRKLPSSAARTAVATRPPRRSRAAMSARTIRRMFQPPESDSRMDDARERTDARGARTRNAIEELAVKSAMAVRSLIRR
mmetsp:Transcript_11621/g.50097  ORF Transcript_11621/g.50097 Transcript_11621/m.50097 type:complete len:200 (-) Transcript_11621:26-625(-)